MLIHKYLFFFPFIFTWLNPTLYFLNIISWSKYANINFCLSITIGEITFELVLLWIVFVKLLNEAFLGIKVLVFGALVCNYVSIIYI
jgi:hypothetical protein